MSSPSHLGFIGDGHRRYAEKNGITLSESYRAGSQKAKDALFWCVESNIDMVTYYALSRQNLERPRDQLQPAFQAIRDYFYEVAEDPEVHEKGIDIRIFGAKDELPEIVLNAAEYAEHSTRDYHDFKVNIGIAYGGRHRLLQGVQRVTNRVEEGQLEPTEIDIETVESELYQIDILPMDIILRTSGETRTSGFLPWFGNGYRAVFHVFERPFPEIHESDLADAINHYATVRDSCGKSRP